MGRFPMPRSGYAKIPVVTQHTTVGDHVQKEEADSQTLKVKSVTFEAEWDAGAVDVALELIASAELPVLQLVWDDLLGQYAIRTEARLIAAIEAGGEDFTYTTVALPTDTYANFASAVATQAIQVRKLSGAPATKLAVTEAMWPALVSMVDSNDRRQFAAVNPSNADASVNLTAESFTLPGGITVFYADITQAILFNGESLKAADGGPSKVQAVNVANMGQDVGVLGRTMFVPRIPAAVRVFGDAPGS